MELQKDKCVLCNSDTRIYIRSYHDEELHAVCKECLTADPDTWEEMGMYGGYCGCGLPLNIVRPGKDQCLLCG